MDKREEVAEVEARIDEYLQAGGLFNPEMMEHDKVRNLLLDCRKVLALIEGPGESIAGDLLPCPFCGGKAEVVSNYGVYWVEAEHTPSCCAMPQMRGMKWADREKAIQAWNTRALPPPDECDKCFPDAAKLEGCKDRKECRFLFSGLPNYVLQKMPALDLSGDKVDALQGRVKELEDLPDLSSYPNLEALLDGRIEGSARFNEYPMVKTEVQALLRSRIDLSGVVKVCPNECRQGKVPIECSEGNEECSGTGLVPLESGEAINLLITILGMWKRYEANEIDRVKVCLELEKVLGPYRAKGE